MQMSPVSELCVVQTGPERWGHDRPAPHLQLCAGAGHRLLGLPAGQAEGPQVQQQQQGVLHQASQALTAPLYRLSWHVIAAAAIMAVWKLARLLLPGL